MTLCIIALDGADARLMPEDWLPTSGSAETFNYSLDYPYTGEIWPTVATGLHPRDHGVTKQTESEWSNIFVHFGARILKKLNISGEIRKQLGEQIESRMGASWNLKETDARTVFDADGRYVHNWPGVYRTEELQRIWSWFRETNKKGMSTAEFMRRTRPAAAGKLGWIEEGVRTDAALVATHVHLLDVVGHLFAGDERSVRQEYDWVIDRIEEIRMSMKDNDDLLVISDHGIAFDWFNDNEESGGHSWHAFTGTTKKTRPTDMFEVYNWIEKHTPAFSLEQDTADLPTEQLKDLGYI